MHTGTHTHLHRSPLGYPAGSKALAALVQSERGGGRGGGGEVVGSVEGVWLSAGGAQDAGQLTAAGERQVIVSGCLTDVVQASG